MAWCKVMLGDIHLMDLRAIGLLPWSGLRSSFPMVFLAPKILYECCDESFSKITSHWFICSNKYFCIISVLKTIYWYKRFGFRKGNDKAMGSELNKHNVPHMPFAATGVYVQSLLSQIHKYCTPLNIRSISL